MIFKKISNIIFSIFKGLVAYSKFKMDEEADKSEIGKREKTNPFDIQCHKCLGSSLIFRNKRYLTIKIFSSILVILMFFIYTLLTRCELKQIMSSMPSELRCAGEIVKQSDKKELFCLIKTTPGALKTNKTLTSFKVWASRCSNYRFITLIPEDKQSTAVKYGNHMEISTPFYITQPEGLNVELYGKITDKLYSAMRYVYSRFNNYEWYICGGDFCVYFCHFLHFLMFLSPISKK
jgi:hypothetical protein